MERVPLEPQDRALAQELRMPRETWWYPRGGTPPTGGLDRLRLVGEGDRRAGFTWELFGHPTDSQIPATSRRLVYPADLAIARALDIYQVAIFHASTEAWIEWREYGRRWEPDHASWVAYWHRSGDMGHTDIRGVERATAKEIRTLMQGRRMLGQYFSDPAAPARAARELKARTNRRRAVELDAEGRTNREIADQLEIPQDNLDREAQVRQLIREGKRLGLGPEPQE
jgi:hypothetical protein